MNIPGKSIFLERLVALRKGLGRKISDLDLARNEFKSGYRGFSNLAGNSQMRSAGLGALRAQTQARFRAQMAMQGARRMAGRAGAPMMAAARNYAQAGSRSQMAAVAHVAKNRYAYGLAGGGAALGGTKLALMKRRRDDQERMMLRNPLR